MRCLLAAVSCSSSFLLRSEFDRFMDTDVELPFGAVMSTLGLDCEAESAGGEADGDDFSSILIAVPSILGTRSFSTSLGAWPL